MSDTTHEAKIIVSGQADGAVRALDDTAKATDKTTTAAKAAGQAQEELAKKIVGTKAANVEAREASEQARRAQEVHTATVKAFGPASAEAAASQKRLADATEAAGRAAASAQKGVQELSAAVAQETAAAEKASPALTRAAKETERLGKECERQAHEVRKMELAQAGAAREAGKLELSYGKFNAGIGRGRGELQGLTSDWAKQSTMLERASGVFDKMGSGLLAGGAVVGMQQLGAAIGAAAERTLKLQSAESSLTISINGAREATGGLISKYQLMTAANSAVSLGVATTEAEFATVSEAATKLALRYGQDVPQSVGNLIGAIGRGSAEMLDNYGVTLKVEDAQRQYAERIGKTVEALTEEEKKNAFKVIALEKIKEAADGANVSLDTQAARLAAMNARWEDFSDRAAVMSTMAFGTIAGVALDAVDGVSAFDKSQAELQLRMDPAMRALMGLESNMRGVRGETYELSGTTEKYVNAIADAIQQTETWAGASTLLSAALLKQAEAGSVAANYADALARSDEAEHAAIVMGPALPPKKKGGGRKKKAEAFDANSEVANARIYRGQYDDIGALGMEQPANTARAQMDEEAEKTERSIALIDREIAANDARGESEARQGDILFHSFERESEVEVERQRLQDERINREIELADFQMKIAQDAEQREVARTAMEEAQHKKRVATIQKAYAEEAKSQAQKVKVFNTLNQSMQQLGASLVDAIEAQAKGEKGAIAESVAEFAKGVRNKMILKAAEETALGVAALAGIVTAGLAGPHFAAAAVAAGAAALAGGAQAAFHAVAKEQGFGAEKVTPGADNAGTKHWAPDDPDGAGPKPSASGSIWNDKTKSWEAPTQGAKPAGRQLDQQEVPVSFQDTRRADASIRQSTPPRPLTVIFQGPVVGAGGIEEVAQQLRRALDQADGKTT